jgi:general secretion pathway protein G
MSQERKLLVMKKAFTLIELVFVIAVIGILAAVAIPKFAATRDDAIVAKARDTVAAMRTTLGMERQKRILRGNFNSSGPAWPSYTSPVLAVTIGGQDLNLTEYPVKACPSASSGTGCWARTGTAGQFVFRGPQGTTCSFTVSNTYRLSKGTCSVSGMNDL